MSTSSVYLYTLLLTGVFSIKTLSQQITFGRISEIPSGKPRYGMMTGDFNGDGIDDIATYGKKAITIHEQATDSTEWHKSYNIPLDTQISLLSSAYCNNDKFSDIVVYDSIHSTVSTFLVKSGGKFYFHWRALIEGFFDGLLVQDINNDNKADIVLFGKQEIGLYVFPGNGNGTFQDHVVLFPDVSFSKLTIYDINGDEVPDIVGINWLSNEVHVYTGFTGMNYSAPHILTFPDEPTQLCVGMIDNDHAEDLVIGFEEQHLVKTFKGDGFGGFNEYGRYSMSQQTALADVTDIIENSRDEMVTLNADESSFTVWSNLDGVFSTPVTYAIGCSSPSLVFFRESSSRRIALASLNPDNGSIRIYHQSTNFISDISGRTFATGVSPRQVLCQDVDMNGWNDIIIANAISHTYFIYLNSGQGRLNGPIVIPTFSSVETFSAVARNDSVLTLYGIQHDANKINITEVVTPSMATSSLDYYTIAKPNVIEGERSSKDISDEIFGIAINDDGRRVLVKYVNTGGSRLTEHFYKINTSIAYGIKGDFLHKNLTEVAFSQYDRQNLKLQIYRFVAGDMKRSQNPKFCFALGVGDSADVLMWHADFNNDGIEDLILNIHAPENVLSVSLGYIDSSFYPPQSKIKGSYVISSPDRLIPYDLDNDNIVDIVLYNERNKNLQMLIGKGDGSFHLAQNIDNIYDLGGFTITNLDNDKIPELIYSVKSSGTLKIVHMKN